MTLSGADGHSFDPVCSTAGFPLLTAAARGVEVWFLLRLMALPATLNTLKGWIPVSFEICPLIWRTLYHQIRYLLGS